MSLHLSRPRSARVAVRAVASTVAALGLAAGTLSLGAQPAAATGKHVEFAESAWGIPAHTKHGRGGVMGAYAGCGDHFDEPDAYKVVVKRDGRTVKKDDRALDDVLRVKRGTYKVTTTVTCGKETRSKTSTVKVGWLRDAETVSKAEYRKIKTGQSVKKVNDIIDGKLEKLGTEDGVTVYARETTSFMKVAFFSFEKGKLVEKDRVDLNDLD